MSSKPIQPHTVDLILQYITPSNLQPLPSHLISKPLLQRHHFLEITPENPKEYLCWPSDTHEDLIYLLESRPVEESRPAYDCRYSFDGDFIYAHVNIDRGVRLIFLWDGSDETWRFHDLNAMPFPVEAKGSPQQLSEPEHKPSLVISLDSPTHENGDDDDYWDAYGTDHDEPNGVSHSMKSATEPSTEDAYWAQYNSVHGSADSTIPSPMPEQARKPSYFGEDANPNDPNAPENGFVSIPSSIFNPGRAPSPGTLSHILSTLEPRPPSTPPSSGTPLGMLPENGVTSPGSAILPNGSIRAIRRRSLEIDMVKLKQPRPQKVNGMSAAIRRNSDLDSGDEGEAPLMDAVRGVYKLWKIQNKGGADKEQFMRLVQEAVERS